MNSVNTQPESVSQPQSVSWQFLLLVMVRQIAVIQTKRASFYFGWLKYLLFALFLVAIEPTTAIATLPTNSLPDSSPATPNALSCDSLPFGNFVPNQSHFAVNSNGQKKYAVDTVWTATLTDGTTATVRTLQVNNNSGNLTSTGTDPDAFFVEFVDTTTGFQSPRLSEREGEIGDSWDLVIEYSRPIGARFLAGDIDSLQTNVAQFKDLLTVEGFLDNASVPTDNIYVGSNLEAIPQGNAYLFQDEGAFGPNPNEQQRSNRIVSDYESTLVDRLEFTYGVGASLAGVGTQSIVMTSGMAAGCNISGSVFEDSNGNDLLDPSEPQLDNIAVSAYLDDGDGVYETDGSDLLIETQDTATGAYEFTKLAENESYWIVVDENDSDLAGYQYDGGNVELSQVNPRLVSVVNDNVTDVNFPMAIANPNQTTNETASCQTLGGSLSGNNLFTPLDNGTFGFENGQPNQSPTVDPYPGVVSGGNFDYFYAVGHGDYGYVANDQQRRNTFQHDNITDPVYGVTGRFFGSDPDTDTPTLTTTLTGLIPNQFYQYSFWAANSEPNPPSSNDVSAIVNGTEIYNTDDLPTFPQTLEWKKHTVSFTNGASDSITIDLASNKTGAGGNDFYLDNIELRSCNFTVDYGDAPTSYGDAIQTTIPSAPNIYLGTVPPDGENQTLLGGDNGVGADGDDNSNAGIDDEDAFSTLSDIPLSGTYDLDNIPVNNTSGQDVTLYGWIDFNRDGKFSASEYQSVTVANGDTTADLSWTVPNGTTAGNTYARFRITPDVLLVEDPSTADVDERSKDAAINGEVEDYQVAIAPPTANIICPTEAEGSGSGYATSGAGIYKDDIFWLDWSCGATAQFDPGDVVEKTWTAPNGIAVTATISNITKTLSPYNTGNWAGDKLDELYGGVNPIGLTNRIDAQDPTYDITFSMSLNGVAIPADIVTADAEDTGNISESVTWITDGTPWQPLEAAPNSRLNATFANGGQSIYLDDNASTFGGGTLLALTENVSTISVDMKAGGKEAIAFGIMIPFDFGDANGYPSSGGHLARRTATGGSQPTTPTPVNSLTMADLVNDSPYLGAEGPDIDRAENSDRPTVNADGDDTSGDDDEDGILLTRMRAEDTEYTIPAENIITNTTGTATLHAWIDFDRDSEFDSDEYQNVTVTNGVAEDLIWNNLSNLTSGRTYARFRITTDRNINGSTPYAVAIDGEMEDYQIAIAPAPLCPAARADLWFANDESGSIDPTEFNNALDFIYQISDGFVYDDVTGMKAGITGWTEQVNSIDIVMPITESFGDPGDFGLFQNNNISLNSNNLGIRKLYGSRQNTSTGTRLDFATEYLENLIVAGNGRRTNTPQVAIIMTDADSSSIEIENSDEDFVWIEAAKKLRRTDTKIVVVLIDEAKTAYDAGGDSRFIVDRVAGSTGRVVTVPSYADAANPALDYIQEVSQAVCDLSVPVATDPGLLLVKRITAIYPAQPSEPETQFNQFVDQPNFNADNHPLWPDSDEDPSSNTNLYLRGVLDAGKVKPGDEVEYTIYFLSQGDEPAEQVTICDTVPDNLTYVKDAYGQEIGMALGYDPNMVKFTPNKYLSNLLNDDAGDFYAPGTSPPTGMCKKVRPNYDPSLDPADGRDNNPNLVPVDGANNDNGAIIVRPAASLPRDSSGQLPTSMPPAASPGQPAASYGFIRFRGRVK